MQTEPEKTQSPSFSRQHEPITEYEDITVPTLWAVQCRALSQLKQDVKVLTEATSASTPKDLLPRIPSDD